MIPIKSDFCLKPYNTFRLAVLAKYFVAISSKETLLELFTADEFLNNRVLILSEGSNLLFTKDFDGLVLHSELWGMNVLKQDHEFVYVEVGAGESWNRLVDYAVNQGWGGIENLTLIPGKVGAAPVQNIGAYGVEVKDVIETVEAFDMTTGMMRKFTAEACGFGYRTSIFKTTEKGRYFITSVVIKLRKAPVLNLSYGPLKSAFSLKTGISVKEVSEEVARVRNSKLPDPDDLPNAGSFFKNPLVEKKQVDTLLVHFPNMPHYLQLDGQEKLAAGWLIEQCGWKGKRIGEVGMHQQQALVLVNYGMATGEQILNLAHQIIDSVNQKFGVVLEPEVNII